ncbi:MAG: type II secretion system protein M [Burkholderiaceae bacterium]
MKGIVGSLVEQGFLRWQSLNARERWMVAACSVFVIVVFSYFVLFKPAWTGRERLTEELPVMRAKVANMEAMAEEAKSLRNVRATQLSASAVRSELQRLLTAAGLDGKSSVDAGQEVIKVKLDRVSFEDATNWLYRAASEVKLRVVDVSIKRDASPGLVVATISLERPGAGS